MVSRVIKTYFFDQIGCSRSQLNAYFVTFYGFISHLKEDSTYYIYKEEYYGCSERT